MDIARSIADVYNRSEDVARAISECAPTWQRPGSSGLCVENRVIPQSRPTFPPPVPLHSPVPQSRSISQKDTNWGPCSFFILSQLDDHFYTPAFMGADAGEWQVAGQNRRRHARRGRSCAQQRPKPYTGRPEVSRSSNRDETSHGYSYKQSNCRVNDGHDHQEVEASRERVWEEVQKLKHLMVLLKRSLLWETLVRHLETVLSTLNLRFPPPLPPRTYPRHQRPCDTSTTCPTTSRRPDSDYCVETADTNVSSSSFHQSMVDRGNERSAASEVGTVDGTEAGGNRVLGRNGHDQLLRELVCYGIGNFTNSHNSRYQLALALCLRDLLFPADASTVYTAAAAHGEHATAATKYESVGCKAADTCAEEPAREEVKSGAPKMQSRTTTTDEASSSSTTENMTGISWDASATEETTGASISHEDRGDGHDHFSMLVFDPVIGKLEITVLEKLGCGVIKENEQGKRCCYIPPKEAGQSEDATLGPWDVGEADEQALWRPTLFFMPHCPMRLYSNLLWANWSSQGMYGIATLATIRG